MIEVDGIKIPLDYSDERLSINLRRPTDQELSDEVSLVPEMPDSEPDRDQKAQNGS
jgi:hypothetical protein